MQIELQGTIVGEPFSFRGGKGLAITVLVPLTPRQQSLAGQHFANYVPVDVPAQVLKNAPKLTTGVGIRVRGFLVAIESIAPLQTEVRRLLRKARVSEGIVNRAHRLCGYFAVDENTRAQVLDALRKAEAHEAAVQEVEKLLKPSWETDRVIVKMVAESVTAVATSTPTSTEDGPSGD